MTAKRIEELIKQTAYPDSNSVYQAMNQVWNEMQQDFNSRICENCEHSAWHDGLLCVKQVCSDVNGGIDNHPYVESDFGCNKWETKS